MNINFEHHILSVLSKCRVVAVEEATRVGTGRARTRTQVSRNDVSGKVRPGGRRGGEGEDDIGRSSATAAEDGRGATSGATRRAR